MDRIFLLFVSSLLLAASLCGENGMQFYPDTPSVEVGEFMPSCVVGGVNVITGNVVHHDEAFRINTIQPLVMDHYFSKQVLCPSTLFDGWQLGSMSRMSKFGDKAYNYKSENVTLLDARNGNYSFWIDDPIGGGNVSSRIHEESSKGSSNCSFGEPSGLSYMPGSKFFRYKEDVYITLPWNEEKKYRFPKGPFGYLYESRMPTGYIVKQNFSKETSYYQNLYTRNGVKLAEILGKMSGLTMSFGTSDGQSATYTFRLATAKHDIIPAMRPGDKDIHIVENHILLDHVTSSSAERVDYRYKLLPSLSQVYSRAHYLTEILYEGGRFRKFSYPIEEGRDFITWKKDAPSLGRVVEVKEPLSSQCATPVTAYRFEYARASGQKNSIFGECHSVKVYDAENKLTYFFYDSVHKRLREVHRTGNGSQGLIQRLGWKENFDPKCKLEEKGVLLANYIRENLATTLISREGGSFYAGAGGKEGLPPSWRLFLYGYDEKHNVISKKIVGHLTGNKDPFVLPYCDKDTTLEAPELFDIYETTYTYYPNRLLKSETTPEGITTHYTYFAETSMPSSKLVSYDGKVQERFFYFYNDFGYLVKTIEDDGCGTDPQDMQGAAVRIETLYTPSFAGVSSGRPARVEKFMVDPLTANHTSLGAEEYSYSDRGNILSKRCFDAEGGFCYEEKFSYNARNQVVSRTDGRGHTMRFKYDVAGNCVLEEGPYPGVKKHRLFNLSNNCYYERQEFPEGDVSVRHDYVDPCQRVIARYDDLGGVTSYRYDGLDRIEGIIHPVVPILGGKHAFREQTSYDLFGNRRYYVDPAGRVFRCVYNIFGKPLSLSSSEGQERYFYRPNGLLERIEYRDGQVAKIHEDPRGRMLSKGLYSKEGELLKEEHWVYKGSLCLKYVDPEGILTEWVYDAAGRILEEKKGRCRNRFEYGSLGVAERVFFYDGEELLKIEEKVHNPLKEVVEERILDKEGNLVFSKKYSYDAFGNCVLEEVGNQKTERRFDSKGRLVFEIKEGVETHYFFDKEVEANGIKCRTMTTVDSEGSHKKEWCDALDRVFHVEFVNPFGEKIYDEKIFYNGEGKIVRRERDPGKGADLEKTHWNYNERGYLVEKIEGVGSSYEVRTRFEYNASGQRSALIKASGVRIEMAYDVRGNLASYASSDGSVDIVFKRDLMGRVLSVKDKNHLVERIYARDGFLEEEITDGVSVKFERDAFNRIKKISALEVTGFLFYSPAGVERAELSARGESHFYSVNERDDAAHILKETFGGVERSYARDVWGRITYFKDPYFERDLITYNTRGSPSSWSEKTPFGERVCAFAYDYQNHLISEGEKTYGYDNIGRRTEKNGATILLSPLGYQTEIDGERVEYDMDGRLISFQGFSYTYDAYDQLLSVKKGDDLILECTYDGLHRLTTIQRPFRKEQILYQENLDIGTVVNGECLHFRLLGTRGRGAEIGEALLFYLNRGLCAPLDDPLGNIIGVVSRERLMHKVRYGAFGEIIEGSTEGMPWSFMGKRQLTEDLIHFGLRTYSSSLGTWLTKDPLGERGGSYAYIFCENNPLRNTDLFGLMPCNRPASSIMMDYDRWTEYSDLYWVGFFFSECYGTDHQGMILPGRVHSFFRDDPNPSTYFTQGQQIPNLLVTYINGVNTPLDYAQETAKIFSERLGSIEGGPVQINGIHNPPSNGTNSMLCRLTEERSFAAIMPACSQLINTWKEYLSPGGQLDPERRVFHICHSEGALITRNAIAKMNADGDRDTAKRIFICSLAGAARIDPLGCGGIVDNITSDFVPYFDMEYHPRCQEVENYQYAFTATDILIGVHDSREPVYLYLLDTNWSSFRERGDFGGVKMYPRPSFFFPSRSYNPYHREEY